MDDVEQWIIKNYHPDSVKLKQLCQSSCVFIKFKILGNGKIGDLAYNKQIPEFITDALSKAVKSMATDAIIIDDLRSDEKVYLLPFVYEYDAGCHNTFVQKKFILIQKDGTGKIADSQQHGEAIFNMLNFTDGDLTLLDCIILPPMYTSNVIMN